MGEQQLPTTNTLLPLLLLLLLLLRNRTHNHNNSSSQISQLHGLEFALSQNWAQ